MRAGVQPPLPSRRARKRGRGQVTVARGKMTGARGPVLRSQTGQFAIPLRAPRSWAWLWRGVPLLAAAAAGGLLLGWRFSDEILLRLDQALGWGLGL